MSTCRILSCRLVIHFQDPYNLEAILAIDDKLAQLIPESEWEAFLHQFQGICSDVEDMGRQSPFDPSALDPRSLQVSEFQSTSSRAAEHDTGLRSLPVLEALCVLPRILTTASRCLRMPEFGSFRCSQAL